MLRPFLMQSKNAGEKYPFSILGKMTLLMLSKKSLFRSTFSDTTFWIEILLWKSSRFSARRPRRKMRSKECLNLIAPHLGSTVGRMVHHNMAAAAGAAVDVSAVFSVILAACQQQQTADHAN